MKYFIIILCLVRATVFPAQNLLQGQPLLEEKGKKNAYPRVSKDGRRVLYQTNRYGKWQLEILDISTKKSTPLLKDGFNNNFPDWSPDNRWVAFVSDRDGNEEVYIVKTDGSGLKRLTFSGARDIHPYFSPDGKHLLFNSDRGNGSFDIYRITLASGHLERLTDTPENETCARYSPDMGHMIFLRNDKNTDDIFSYDFKTKRLTNLTNTPGSFDGWPMYGHSGQWIYFSSLESGLYCLYKMRTDGSGRQQVSKPSNGEEDVRACVSADGRLLVFNKESGQTISIYTATLKT